MVCEGQRQNIDKRQNNVLLCKARVNYFDIFCGSIKGARPGKGVFFSEDMFYTCAIF